MSEDIFIKEPWRKNLKFSKDDRKYLIKRQQFSKRQGLRELWNVIDHWPLYCGIRSFSRYVTIIDSLRSTLDVPGNIAEFGSWKGSVLMLMAKVLRIYDPHSSKITHCFESFEGMNDDPKKYRGSYKELKELISLYNMDNEIIIHKGKIEKKLPQLLEMDKSLAFSFVYYDIGEYNVAKFVLDNIHSRLSKNALILFDEWNIPNAQGEGEAVIEFLKKYPNDYEMIHVKNTSQPSLILKKITNF